MADIIKHDKQRLVPQAVGYPFSSSGEAQAGGLPDFSRWLTERESAEMASPKAMARRAGYGGCPLAGGHIHNEAWRATPPEKYHKEKRIPEGCQMFRLSTSGTPSGCGYFYHEFRWCRSLTRPQPQPPAKIFQASGLRNRRTKTTAKPFPNRATRLPEPARATLGIESPSPANLEKVASD